jgi:hypothetical protein
LKRGRETIAHDWDPNTGKVHLVKVKRIGCTVRVLVVVFKNEEKQEAGKIKIDVRVETTSPIMIL